MVITPVMRRVGARRNMPIAIATVERLLLVHVADVVRQPGLGVAGVLAARARVGPLARVAALVDFFLLFRGEALGAALFAPVEFGEAVFACHVPFEVGLCLREGVAVGPGAEEAVVRGFRGAGCVVFDYVVGEVSDVVE